MELSPASIETNNEEIKEEKSFQFQSNKQNNFNIIFQNCSSYIKLFANIQKELTNIFANIQKELTNKVFEKIYYLEDLKKNKFLAICDSIDEVYEQLIFELEKKNNKRIIEKEKEIEIIIPVEHIKVKEIKFILLAKIKSNEELFQYIFNELNTLKNDINILKEENNNLKNEINILKNENKNIKEDLLKKEKVSL